MLNFKNHYNCKVGISSMGKKAYLFCINMLKDLGAVLYYHKKSTTALIIVMSVLSVVTLFAEDTKGKDATSPSDDHVKRADEIKDESMADFLKYASMSAQEQAGPKGQALLAKMKKKEAVSAAQKTADVTAKAKAQALKKVEMQKSIYRSPTSRRVNPGAAKPAIPSDAVANVPEDLSADEDTEVMKLLDQLSDLDEEADSEAFEILWAKLEAATERADERLEQEQAALDQEKGQDVKLPKTIPSISTPITNKKLSKNTTTPEKPVEEKTKKTKPRPEVKAMPSVDLDAKIDLKTTNNELKIEKLIEFVGKTFQYTFLYEGKTKPSYTVKIENYGTIYYRDLMPLLENMLSASGYHMVVEGTFVRVIAKKDVWKKTLLPITDGEEMPILPDGQTVVSHTIKIKHVDPKTVEKFLLNFIDATSMKVMPEINSIIITEYSYRMPRLFDMIKIVDQPVSPKGFKTFQVNYLEVSSASKMVKDLMLKLKSASAMPSTSTTTTPSPEISKTTDRSRSSRERAVSKRKVPPNTKVSKSPVVKSTLEVIENKRLGRLYVIGTLEELKQFEDILFMVDVPVDVKVEMDVYVAKHVGVDDLSKQALAILKDLSGAGVGTSATSSLAKPSAPVKSSSSRRTPPKPPLVKKDTSSSGSGKQGPYVHIDERTSRLFVIGSKVEIAQLFEIAQLIDVAQGPEIRLDISHVKYVGAEDLADQLINILKDLGGVKTSSEAASSKPSVPSRTKIPPPTRTSPKAPASSLSRGSRSNASGSLQVSEEGPFIHVDERTNRLLVIGSDDQITQILDLQKMIDVPNGPDIRVMPVPVLHINAEEAAILVVDLMKDLASNSSADTLTETTNTSRSNRTATPMRSSQGSSSSNRTTSSRNDQQRYGSSYDNGSTALKVTDMGPFLHIDVRTNRILLIGSDSQIVDVLDLLKMVDIVNGPEISLEEIQIQHVLVDDLAGSLIELIKNLNKDDYLPEGSNQGGMSGSNRNNNRNSSSNSSRGTINSNTTSSRRSTSGRDSRSSSGSETGGVFMVSDNGPFLHTDPRTNRLLVIGAEEQFGQIKELIFLLDIPAREYEQMILEVYQPQYIEAEEVRQIMSDLGIIDTDQVTDQYSARERARGGDRTKSSSSRGASNEGEKGVNSGFGSGPELLPHEEEVPIRVAIQATMNKIFVMATRQQQEDIRIMMAQIDQQDEDALGAIRIYTINNQNPDVITGALQEVYDSDQTVVTSGKSGDVSQHVPGIDGAPIIISLPDTHSIMVRATAKQHQEIKELLVALDRKLPQVLIEAILIQIDINDDLKIGVELGDLEFSVSEDRVIKYTSPFSAIGTYTFMEDTDVYATIEAIQSNGNSKIISKPRLLVSANQGGEDGNGVIKSEQEVPVTTSQVTPSSGLGDPLVTTQFDHYETAGTTLTIIPKLGSSDADSLVLDIELDVTEFTATSAEIENVPPPKISNNIKTTVVVPDGKTIILGGLSRESDSLSIAKLPILGDIPLVGLAFRSSVKSKKRSVLYVFIKAHIIDSDQDFDGEHGLGPATDEALNDVREKDKYYEDTSIVPKFKKKITTEEAFKSAIEDLGDE